MASRSDKPPEFFVDRSLGKSIVEGLRATGLTVHSMAGIYGEEQAQGLPDETWLRDAGVNGWIVLTKDDAIRRRPAERDALTDAAVRVFCLTNRNLRGTEQTARFVSNRHRIIPPGPANPVRISTGCTSTGSDDCGPDKQIARAGFERISATAYRLTQSQILDG
jgi:PIN like domain